jgi:outer membrane protein TolC
VPRRYGAIRPEFVAAAERTRAADEQVRGAKSGYLPRVSGFGSLDYDRGWVTDGDGESYTGGRHAPVGFVGRLANPRQR